MLTPIFHDDTVAQNGIEPRMWYGSKQKNWYAVCSMHIQFIMAIKQWDVLFLLRFRGTRASSFSDLFSDKPNQGHPLEISSADQDSRTSNQIRYPKMPRSDRKRMFLGGNCICVEGRDWHSCLWNHRTYPAIPIWGAHGAHLRWFCLPEARSTKTIMMWIWSNLFLRSIPKYLSTSPNNKIVQPSLLNILSSP